MTEMFQKKKTALNHHDYFMMSFITTVRHMTEMFQWPKYLSKNDQNVSAKQKQLWITMATNSL